MICEECKGSGRRLRGSLPVIGVMPGVPVHRVVSVYEPCPTCGGSGVAHCCDGPVGLSSDVTNKGGALLPQKFRPR